MRFGPYSAGRRVETFLRERLAWGPVPVSQLAPAARQEGIARATLYRTAQRIGVVRTSTEAGKLWALPAEPVPAESEEQAVAVAPVTNVTPEEVGGVARVEQSVAAESHVAQVAEIDPRLEGAVAAARRLMARGVRREAIVHRIRKALGAELADAVKAEIGRG